MVRVPCLHSVHIYTCYVAAAAPWNFIHSEAQSLSAFSPCTLQKMCLLLQQFMFLQRELPFSFIPFLFLTKECKISTSFARLFKDY